MYNFTILHIMYMYIYHFLVSWNGREFDYWHTNRVGSVLSAAHTFYVTPTSQRACALAFMSPFSTVSVFYVTPAQFENWLRQFRLGFVLLKFFWGNLWFTGRTLFYLLFRGFYHIGIRKIRNNMSYKWFNSPYTKRKQGCGGAAPIF